MHSDLYDLVQVMRKAFDQISQDHDTLGEAGKQPVAGQQAAGRRSTHLAVLATTQVLNAARDWCLHHPKGLRVYLPGSAVDFGTAADIAYSLWFSGLISPNIYTASTADNKLADRAYGYGMTYAIGRGADPTFNQIEHAVMLRLDTGERLVRSDCGEVWHSVPGQKQPGVAPYKRTALDKCLVLADQQFCKLVPGVVTHDMGSTFGNAFSLVLGCNIWPRGPHGVPQVAVGAFGHALPALCHLIHGCEGFAFLPGFRRLVHQPMRTVVDSAHYSPCIIGERVPSLGIVSAMKK